MSDSEMRMEDADEEMTVQLLRLAGPRSPVPLTREARVRAAVHAQWQVGARRRATRRRVVLFSVFLATAAILVLMVGLFILVDRRGAPLDEFVAVVEQVEGTPRRVMNTPDAAVAALSVDAAIRTGEWIETDGRSRLALRFPDGTSVRLDVGSRARPLSSNVIELSDGAAYLDTGRESGRFEVRTALATALDVGTQFEVRLLERAVRLRVRTGVVELRDAARSVSGRAGTEITLSAARAASRPIPVYGSEWDWIARVSPHVDIEGLTLSAFLERIGRENGWSVQYADPALAVQASGIILHGSVRGLPPHDAVAVAIATSGLKHRLAGGELVVRRGSDAK